MAYINANEQIGQWSESIVQPDKSILPHLLIPSFFSLSFIFCAHAR